MSKNAKQIRRDGIQIQLLVVKFQASQGLHDCKAMARLRSVVYCAHAAPSASKKPSDGPTSSTRTAVLSAGSCSKSNRLAVRSFQGLPHRARFRIYGAGARYLLPSCELRFRSIAQFLYLRGQLDWEAAIVRPSIRWNSMHHYTSGLKTLGQRPRVLLSGRFIWRRLDAQICLLSRRDLT
jgi:hypothetical protein